MFNINIYITVGVRKRDGTEYKRDTLTGIQNSIDRHLKNLKPKGNQNLQNLALLVSSESCHKHCRLKLIPPN